MISLRRPSEPTIVAFRERMRDAPFGYPEVGATEGGALPGGYHVDRSEEELGRGAEDFAAARGALAAYRHYDAPEGRIRIVEPRPAFEPGEVVTLLGCHLGIWTLSACRVVYTFDDEGTFGFGYGTLEHAVRGEERFEVAMERDERVVFRLLAFSVPATWLLRLGAPVARRFQIRAGRDYAHAIRLAMRAE